MRPLPATILCLGLLSCSGAGSTGETGGVGVGEDGGSGDGGSGDSGSGDSGSDDTGELPEEVDADGDGYPSWQTAHDQDRADCDDADPNVTPLTERFLPEGPFLRGNDGEPHTDPQREIWISPVCLDRTEVTNEAFVAFLEARDAEGQPNLDDEGRPLYDFDDDDDIYPERIQRGGREYTVTAGYEDHPVVEVYQWSGGAYCAWRGQRLPTEAEWEKGARGAEDARPWPWSADLDEVGCAFANITLKTMESPGGEICVEDTTPVGTYPEGASPYGLLDMSGNAAEWVSDWFLTDYYADSPDTDPQGPDYGWSDDIRDGEPARVSRGGSYLTNLLEDRVFYRYAEPEDATSNGVGFRCARTL